MFFKDESLDLRDEYLKDLNALDSEAYVLNTNWCADSRSGVDLQHLSNALCTGK